MRFGKYVVQFRDNSRTEKITFLSFIGFITCIFIMLFAYIVYLAYAFSVPLLVLLFPAGCLLTFFFTDIISMEFDIQKILE